MPPITGPIDVALSLFSGLCTELSPTDVPEGISPDNQDMEFLPGSTSSRRGLAKLFGAPFTGNPQVNYAKTYRQANGNPLNLYLDALGILRTEDVVNNPGRWNVLATLIANAFCNSVTHDNKEFFAFHDGTHPVDIPRQFDGTFLDRVSQDGPASQVAAVDSANAGTIVAGVHQVAVCFITRQGYITKPSQPFSWNAAGGKKVNITNLPIGPPNVIARLLIFTGAGGANFFAILSDSNVPGGVYVKSTIVADNTSVAAELDFADNSLFGATAVDIPGNNLFNLVPLAPCVGVESFSDRLFWWGEFNKVQGFIGMGFEGGLVAPGGIIPLGWTNDTVGGALVLSPTDFGYAWQITGDGTANQKGRILQGAYQNYLLNPILEPSTKYTFVCWAQSSQANQGGNLVAELFSIANGVLASAVIPLGQIPNASGKFVQADFSAATPAVITSDTQLRVYATGMPNGQTVTIDELMVVFTAQPYRENDCRVSYFLNPESYDGITGDLGPSSDSSPIRASAIIEKTLYLLTGERLHQTRDNGTGEPATWDVDQIADKCGAVSPRAVAKAKKWFFWVSQEDSELSLTIFGGSEPVKISQEVQPNFSAINQDAMSAIWAVNDGGKKRVYIGVPGANVNALTSLLAMDYRELETPSDIATYGPIHIGFTGKMIASDRVRKWAPWNLPMNCGAILNRSKNRKEFCVGSGGAGFGNVYRFDAAKLTDDDYGQIVPSWTSYFFVNHEMEQALPVGVHRKLYDKLTVFITGVGLLQITPLADRLANAVQFTSRQGGPLANTIQLKQNLNADIEIPGEVSCERLAVKISVLPITDQANAAYTNGTDVQFNLQHLSLRMQVHPVSPVAGLVR